jgi:holo-[acyl-carrier protein] synthase
MKIGVGVDIIEIYRIRDAMHRHTNFLIRNFSERERKYFATKFDVYETVAGNFAAKEAFSKAIGTGIRGFSLNDIEVLRNVKGAPYILFKGRKPKAEVSISHSKTSAVAVVLLKKSKFFRI